MCANGTSTTEETSTAQAYTSPVEVTYDLAVGELDFHAGTILPLCAREYPPLSYQ